VRDREYLLAVKGLPCLLEGTHFAVVRDGDFYDVAFPCEGPVEADHAGARPLGRKCNDVEAIPLCRLHHRQRTDGTGLFAGVSREALRMWLTTAIAETQARLGRAA